MYADLEKFRELWNAGPNAGPIHRAISILKLRNLLADFPPEWFVQISRVGELNLFAPSPNPDEYFLGEWKGYIALGEEKWYPHTETVETDRPIYDLSVSVNDELRSGDSPK